MSTIYSDLPAYPVVDGPQPSAYTALRRQWQEKQAQQDPANAVFAKYLEATFNTNLPAYPLSSPFNQVQHYNSVVYLGIQTLIDAMSGAKCQLEMKVRGAKGKAAPSGRKSDSDYVPFDEEHPLNDILRHPNDVDTFAQFMAQIIIQWHLTGKVYIWGPPGDNDSAPRRLYVIPTPLVTPAVGLANQHFPKGAYYVQQYYPTTGLMGIVPGPLAGTAGVRIDSREFYILQNPHPLYRWAPQSPTQAGSVGIDLLEMIDRSCWSVMRNGVKPSGVLDAPGADSAAIDALQARISQRHSGPDNHGGIIVLGGGKPDRPGMSFNSIVPSADVMGFTSEWERCAGQLLSTVCGLDLRIVGLRTGGSYSEYWAAVQEVRVRKYEPFLARVADALTDGPVKDWGLSEDGVRVCISLPPMADPTLIENQCASAAGDGTLTYNEIRAKRGEEPVDGGDVPTSIYLKLLEKQLGIDPLTEALQQQEAMFQLQMQEQAAAAGGGEKKSSGGKDKKGKKKAKKAKNNRTQAPGDVKRPKNKGGKGSLGKRQKKAVEYAVRASEEDITQAVLASHRAVDATRETTHDVEGLRSHPFAALHAAVTGNSSAAYVRHKTSQGLHEREYDITGSELHKSAALAHKDAADYHSRILASNRYSNEYPETVQMPLIIQADHADDKGHHLANRIRGIKALPTYTEPSPSILSPEEAELVLLVEASKVWS